MDAIAKKVGTGADAAQNAVWLVGGIQYLFKREQLGHHNISSRLLSGKGQPSGKGLCDLILLKQGCRKCLLTTWLDESPLTLEHKDMIDDFHAHETSFQPCSDNPDLTWMGVLPVEGRKYVELAQKLIYTCQKDKELRQALVGGSAAADLPDREEFKSDFAALRAGWKELATRLGKDEGSAPPEATPASSSGDLSMADFAPALQPLFHNVGLCGGDSDPKHAERMAAQDCGLCRLQGVVHVVF